MYKITISLEMSKIYLENGEPQKALIALKGIEDEPVIGLMASFLQGTAHLKLRYLAEAQIYEIHKKELKEHSVQ